MSGPRGSSIKRDISCAADSPPTDRKVSKSSINIWGCVMLDASDYYEEVTICIWHYIGLKGRNALKR